MQGYLYIGSAQALPTSVVSSGGTSDTITAINNTDSAISKNDKVWVNKLGSDYNIVDFYSKIYNNFTIVGSPTIDYSTGIISGFSASKYLQLPQVFSPGNNTWEIVICITPNDIQSSQHFFGVTNNNAAVLIEVFNGTYTMYLSASGGTTWDIVSRSTQYPGIAAQNNTKTWVKISFDGTKYTLQTSTDGTTYNTGYYVSSTSTISQDKTLYIGACWDKNNNQYFKGSFDLSQCYIKINNEIWWKADNNTVSEEITSNTFTGIAAENIAISGMGDVEVGEVVESALGTKTITQNGIYNASSDNLDGYSSVTVDVPFGGDTVTATNTTGNTIASGDKVWLTYDTSTSDGITDYLTYSTQNVVTNNIIDSFSDNFLIYSSTSYKGNINWTNLELSLGASTSISSLQRAFYTNEGGFVFDNGSASKYYKNNNITSLGYTWYVLGGLVTNNRVNRYMTYYDCVDGVVDTSKSFITNDATGVSTENVFYLRTYNEWYWLSNRYSAINIRGIQNPSFNGSTYSTDSDTVVNTNGCTTQIGITSDDKYILLCDGSYNRADSDSNAATHFTILKRNSYKNFSPVTTNLPASMQDWLQDQSTVRQFLYNPMNDVLICTDLSTAKKLSIYKYIPSTETWEEVSIAVNSFIPNEYPFVKNVSISAGLDKLLLQCSENASDTTKRLFAVKLAANGKWFIIPFTNITTASISGYASENIAVFGTGDVNIGVDLTPTKKYKLLDRIKDDSNNEIGTVSGFFIDANNVEYAVVCLDTQYRLASSPQQYLSQGVLITSLPVYDDSDGQKRWGPWESKQTATYNTQKILDFCSSQGYTSSACTHCRSLSFVIDGVTYYGQLPNIVELSDINKIHTTLDALDPTAASTPGAAFMQANGRWSSNQYSTSQSYGIGSKGEITYFNKTGTFGTSVPVLEIPNT